jgi:hypothetical protein
MGMTRKEEIPDGSIGAARIALAPAHHYCLSSSLHYSKEDAKSKQRSTDTALPPQIRSRLEYKLIN